MQTISMSNGREIREELLSEIEERWNGLPDKPEETPAATLRVLWLLAAGIHCSVDRAMSTSLPPLESNGLADLRVLVEARLSGTPLAHLTGRQSFMGLELLAGPDALIPRRETELLGWEALEILRGIVAERGEARVLDLCTGAGNLAVALALHEPAATVHASDISPGAIALAERNVERFGLEERVICTTGDLFEPFEAGPNSGAFDLIVCNPPYVTSSRVASMPHEISDFEPRLAFDGGALGIGIILRLLIDSPRHLRPGGWLCFEVGAGQGKYLLGRVRSNPNFAEPAPLLDPAGEIRAIAARKTL